MQPVLPSVKDLRFSHRHTTLKGSKEREPGKEAKQGHAMHDNSQKFKIASCVSSMAAGAGPLRYYSNRVGGGQELAPKCEGAWLRKPYEYFWLSMAVDQEKPGMIMCI